LPEQQSEQGALPERSAWRRPEWAPGQVLEPVLPEQALPERRLFVYRRQNRKQPLRHSAARISHCTCNNRLRARCFSYGLNRIPVYSSRYLKI